MYDYSSICILHFIQFMNSKLHLPLNSHDDVHAVSYTHLDVYKRQPLMVSFLVNVIRKTYNHFSVSGPLNAIFRYPDIRNVSFFPKFW